LPFEVTCPQNGDGRLVARRARRTGNVFYGCSAYPTCDYTTNDVPNGAFHDADGGPVAQRGDGWLCLKCGASVPVQPDVAVVGARLAGGPPDPVALQRQRAARGGAGKKGAPRRGGTRKPARRSARASAAGSA
jgi:hypothetical protein